MQGVRVPMGQAAWAGSGEALMKKSPAPLGKQLLSQRRMLSEESIRSEVRADLIWTSSPQRAQWALALCRLSSLRWPLALCLDEENMWQYVKRKRPQVS